MHRKVVSLCAISLPVLFLTLAAFQVKPVRSETLNHSSRLSIDAVRVERVGDVSRISVDGYERLSDAGKPALPYKVISILLPYGEAVESFRFEPGTQQVMPARQPVEIAEPFVSEDGKQAKGMARVLTGADGMYPDVAGRYLGTGYLHGRAIASFALYPVRAKGSDLMVAERVNVTVETTARTDDKEVIIRERFRPGFQQRVDRDIGGLVVNPEMTERYQFDEVKVPKPRGGFQPTSYPSLEGSAVDYVIITTDALSGIYQDFADWKTAKGVPTVVRTVEWILANTRNGADVQETIRFFVRDAYAKWGITYLLLGGDTDILPPRYAFSRFYSGADEIPVDMYFTCLDGSWNENHDSNWGEGFYVIAYDDADLYAEVYNGRVPLTDPVDVQIMLDKIKSYEVAENRDYMDRLMFLGEVLFPPTWKPGEIVSLNGADFGEFILGTSLVGVPLDVVKMFETHTIYSGAVPENRQAAIDSINAGFNHINHVGHGYRFNMSVGDASIVTNDALALTNTGKWTNLYKLNCTTCAYGFPCLAEFFLRNPDGGAVSVIGANDSAFPTASAPYMNEYYDQLFKYDAVHIGEAFAKSRLPKTPIAETGDNVDQWTHFIYTILADPEMILFTGTVDTVDVIHAASVSLGPNAILVNVMAGGLPVDSATVCLSKDDDDYQVATTNSIGNVIIDFTAESAGSISVVVTGLNIARHQSYIEVTASAGAYVNFSDATVDEDSIGGSYGNGDGVIDAGETVDFTLDLTNTGLVASDSVWVIVRTTTGSVTILDSIAAVGVIASGGTETALDPIRVHFDAALADEAVVDFDVEIHDTSPATWDDIFRREVHAPELQLTTLRIDDTLGNGDGIVNPGEPFLLFYEVKNYGTGTAYGLEATLEDLDSLFTFIDSADTYPDITPFTAAENASGFHIIEQDTTSENNLEVTITDIYGRTLVDSIELRGPDAPLILVFDSSLGTDRLQVTWPFLPGPEIKYFNLYRSATAGPPYEKANKDLLEHSVFVDTGLDPSTKYYYVATTVDESGNESVLSAEFSATTNPPQQSGFPLYLEAPSTSSPAVGDIDGDGDPEVVVGGDFIYAWHADGLELRDGDGEPQTWGIIDTAGHLFTADVALAKIDANPGLEIIATDLNTPAVYIMDYNGAPLPGWPQMALGDFRAAPTIGDIDGDLDPEIIAVDHNGRIYVWNTNGTEYKDGDSNPGTQGVFYVTPATSFHYITPSVCDIDSDGEDEILLPTRSFNFYVLNEDGSNVPGFPYVMNGEGAGSAVTGDIDNDGLPEILVHSKGSGVYLLNHDGTLAPGWPRFASLNNFFGPSPALADFDGDGTLEIVIVGYTVTASKIYVIDHQGNNLPGWPLVYANGFYSESSPVIADIDGDESMDIILGDESKFIRAWNINAQPIAGFPIATGDAVRSTPYVTDLDRDGDLDMIAMSWDQNLYVYDLQAPYRPGNAQWPTIQGNIHRNGKFGDAVATGAGGGLFTFSFVGDAIDLVWTLDKRADGFDLLRATIEEGRQGAFTTVVTGLTVNGRSAVEYRDGSVEMGGTYVYQLVAREDPGDVFTTKSIYVPIHRADLAQNYPNPFNPTTKITYFVPDGGARLVNLVIYDVRGAKVKTLVDEAQPGGKYAKVWDGLNDGGNTVSSGVYFYRLTQPGYTATKKMILLK